ncbi:MAG: PAS domain S-box protein [Chloroflexi bacterium]|nr:PAS domain S-box protein [Chloroflexota bacterium]
MARSDAMPEYRGDIAEPTGSHIQAIRFVVGEDRFRALLEAAPDAMVIVDQAGRIVELNQQAERLFLYPRAELLGAELELLLPKAVRSKHAQHRRDYNAEPRSRPMGMGLALAARRKDGSEVPVEISLSPLQTADGVLVIAAIRDISAHQHALAIQRQQTDLLHLAHDSIFVMDLDDRITFWNRGAAERYGWSQQEALGQVTHILLRTEFPRPREEIQEELDRTGYWEGELVHRTRTGQRMIVASRWALQRDAHGTPTAILEINNDITDRKRAEDAVRELYADLEQRVQERTAQLQAANRQLGELNVQLEEEIAERKHGEAALHESEEQYRTLFEHIPDVAVVREMVQGPDGDTIDFITRQVNPAWEKSTGISRDKAIGKTIRELVPNIEPYWLDLYAQVALTGKPARIENYIRVVDKWFENSVYSPKRGYVVAVARDITERKQAEERMRYQAALVEHASDAITSSDENFVIRTWNQAAQDLFGWRAEEVIGKRSSDVLPAQVQNGQDRQAAAKEFLENGYWRGEVTYRRKDGSQVSTLVASVALRDSQGKITGALAIHTDITERKRAEEHIRQLNQTLEEHTQDLEMTSEELRVTNEDLQSANDNLRIANEGLLVANEELEGLAEALALDLRRPLVSIRHLTQLISQDHITQLPSETQPMFQLIQANADEMEQMAQALLQVTAITRQPLEKQTVSSEELVRGVLGDLRWENRDRQIETTLGVLPDCQGDPALLDVVWRHLLSNAVKFTRARRVAHIEIGSHEDGGHRVYFVKDNGVGFSMDYAQTIFRAFQRYHRDDEYAGAGVGLTIVERIIRRHGGRVWAEGAVDQGATLYFTLD